ncbi:MAG: glycine cleavage system protein H [bacterium]
MMTEQDHAEQGVSMGDLSHRGKHPIVPSDEIRCVWMTAGILSYQLCERNFECERCPLDRALRGELTSQENSQQTVSRQEPTSPIEEHTLRAGILYDTRHMWLKEEGHKMVIVGLESGIVSKLLSPRAIILPSIGEQLTQDKICCWIVIEGGTLPLFSPIRGKVVATNAMLKKNPHLLLKDAWGEGWLFNIDSSKEGYERSRFLSPESATDLYREDAKQFNDLVVSYLSKRQTRAGMTMADGGMLIDKVSEILGPKKYCQALSEVFLKFHIQ